MTRAILLVAVLLMVGCGGDGAEDPQPVPCYSSAQEVTDHEGAAEVVFVNEDGFPFARCMGSGENRACWHEPGGDTFDPESLAACATP